MTISSLKNDRQRPNGFNVLGELFSSIQMLKEENKILKDAIIELEERINTLTLNIPEATLNAIIARSLHMHAQVLLAATSPQPQQDQPQSDSQEMDQEEPEEEVAISD